MATRCALRYCCLLLALGATFVSTQVYNLKAEYAQGNLGAPRSYAQTYYDGNDTIYLFGGVWTAGTNQILRYDLKTDSIIYPSAFMPSPGYRGSVQAYGKDIYYFGALTDEGPEFRDIIKFDSEANTTMKVAELPFDGKYHTSFKGVNDSIVYFLFSFDNPGSSLYSCDMSTYAFESLSFLNYFATGFSSIVIDNVAYIYGHDMMRYETKVLRMDLTSMESEMLPGKSPPFGAPFPFQFVSDGLNGYIFGGFDPHAGVNTDLFMQFNIESQAWTYLDVENFPVHGDVRYEAAPGAVFVNKLNRIYYFGGHTWDRASGANQFENSIWYIDLTPLSNPVFSCQGKPDEMYPHPLNCSKFIGCRDEVSTNFDCPEPLLFDPLTARCDHPENVDCSVSCTGKQDGEYPHLRDCSKFILCHEELLSVFHCPPPLLFDSVLFKCNYPDLVNCTVPNTA